MRFSATQIVLGVAALIGLSQADDCSNGPWSNVQSVGGGGGKDWCETKHKEGITISGLEVWGSSKYVEQIQFSYSDDTVGPIIGKVFDGSSHQKLEWDPSATVVESLNLWGNGNGKYLGRVQLTLTDGKSLDVGKNTKGQTVYSPKVGSGIILGAYGAQDDIINRVGFLFLKSKVDKVKISDLEFDEKPQDLNKRKQGIQIVTLDEAKFSNNQQSSNQTVTFAKTNTQTKTTSFTQTNAHKLGVKVGVEVEGKVLGFGGAKFSSELSYEYTNTQSKETSQTTTVTLTYSTAVNLKPGETVYCRATAQQGSYKGGYNSKVSLALCSRLFFPDP